jgi:hypothetical protein
MLRYQVKILNHLVGRDNPWHYGYIGKFEEEREWNWERKTGGDGEKVLL